MYCYDCRPGGPYKPPPCRKCGSETLYYSAGLCQRCHRFAPQVTGSCRDCLCWGVTRTTSWLCEPCRGWRKRFTVSAPCGHCGRVVPVNDEGSCRLCRRQAALIRRTEGRGTRISPTDLNCQQLFLAGMFRRQPGTKAPAAVTAAGPARPRAREYPVPFRQLTLVELAMDLAAGKLQGFPEPADPAVAALLDAAQPGTPPVTGGARPARRTPATASACCSSLQHTPGSRISASEVQRLSQIGVATAARSWTFSGRRSSSRTTRFPPSWPGSTARPSSTLCLPR